MEKNLEKPGVRYGCGEIKIVLVLKISCLQAIVFYFLPVSMRVYSETTKTQQQCLRAQMWFLRVIHSNGIKMKNLLLLLLTLQYIKIK